MPNRSRVLARRTIVLAIAAITAGALSLAAPSTHDEPAGPDDRVSAQRGQSGSRGPW